MGVVSRGEVHQSSPHQGPAIHDPQNPYVESWSSLDQIDLGEIFSQRMPMLKSCPHFLRGPSLVQFLFHFA